MTMNAHYRNDFQRLLAGERPDGVVWTADLSYWISGRQADGTADPAWQTECGYLELHRSLGVMPYYFYERFWTGRAVYDATVRERVEADGPVTIRLWETPAGTLREESRYLPESACQGVTQHPVRTPADLDILEHVERVLECWQGQPFVLGVADQVPPDGDIGFCRKIAEVVCHG